MNTDQHYRSLQLDGPVTAGLLRELVSDPDVPDQATFTVGTDTTGKRKVVVTWVSMR